MVGSTTKYKKGQFFIVSAVLLTAIFLTIYQTISTYSSADLSSQMTYDEVYFVKNFMDAVNKTINNSAVCSKVVLNLEELKNLMQESSSLKSYQTDLTYDIDCPQEDSYEVNVTIDFKSERMRIIAVVNSTVVPPALPTFWFDLFTDAGKTASSKNVTIKFGAVNITGNATLGMRNILNDSSKTANLTFSGTQSKTVYIRLPKMASVLNATMNLTGYDDGTGSSYPTNASLDVGNDGDREWERKEELIYHSLNEPTSSGKSNYITGTSIIAGISSTDPSQPMYTWFLIETPPNSNVSILSVNISSRWQNPENYNFIYNITICPTALSSLTTNENSFCTEPYTTVKSNANLSSIFGATYDWKNITFDSEYAMDPSKNYIIKFVYVSSTAPPLTSRSWSLAFDPSPSSANQVYFYSRITWNETREKIADMKFYSSGKFNTTEKVADFAAEVNASLQACQPDVEGNCDIPLNFSSAHGVLNISSINVTYWVPYYSSGNLTSVAITPPSLSHWDKFIANYNAPTNTKIVLQILDASNGAKICPAGAQESLAGNDDISVCAGSTPSIKLFAKLNTTDNKATPSLKDWNATWVPV